MTIAELKEDAYKSTVAHWVRVVGGTADHQTDETEPGLQIGELLRREIDEAKEAGVAQCIMHDAGFELGIAVARAAMRTDLNDVLKDMADAICAGRKDLRSAIQTAREDAARATRRQEALVGATT